MKLSTFSQLLALAVLVCLAATGCKHKTPPPTLFHGTSGTTGSENPNLPPGEKLPGAGEAMTGIPSNPAGSHEGWIPNATVFQAYTVHFAYDRSDVRGEDKSKVQSVADYLKSNPADAVRIEGHCDERGTEEYNRALGERRALALREQLAGMGIEPSRVDTISYGKDRPESPGHDEAAWSQNRRGVFILLTPPNK